MSSSVTRQLANVVDGAGPEPIVQGVIQVLDLEAVELVNRASHEIGLSYLEDTLATWDFLKGRSGEPTEGRGRRYEVLTWAPRIGIYTEKVRDRFKSLKAEGSVVALIAWVTKVQPEGSYVTIPGDDDFLYKGSNGNLYAPCFTRDKAYKGLSLYSTGSKWLDLVTFTAFREVMDT